MTIGDNSYNTAIVGQVKNNARKTFRSVIIKINLYDDNGAQIGSTMDAVSNLEPAGIWSFRTFASSPQGYTKAFKVKEISGS